MPLLCLTYTVSVSDVLGVNGCESETEALGKVVEGENEGESKKKGEGGGSATLADPTKLTSVRQELGGLEAKADGELDVGEEQVEEATMAEEEAGEPVAATRRSKVGRAAKASKVGEESRQVEGSVSEGCVSLL